MSAWRSFIQKGTEFEASADFEIGSSNVTSFVGGGTRVLKAAPGAPDIDLETISAADEETLVRKRKERFGADTVIRPAI